MNTRKVGTEKEDRAAAFIESHGGQVTERNFRSRMGEIDLIARDGEAVCFIEVKYRKNAAAGYPAEAVGAKKQFTICRVADFYRMKKQLPDDIPYRFDVIGIIGNEIKWYKNAFQYVQL